MYSTIVHIFTQYFHSMGYLGEIDEIKATKLAPTFQVKANVVSKKSSQAYQVFFRYFCFHAE